MLLKTGEAGKDGKYDAEPDFWADDLLGAVEHIFKVGDKEDS